LAELSPLDLLDLLPVGAEVRAYDRKASTVTVTCGSRIVTFWFATDTEIAQKGLKIVDSSIPSLFKVKPSLKKAKGKSDGKRRKRAN
jgi:hypothetical protein